MPDISTTDITPGQEELKASEIFQNAIQRALASIRDNGLDNALLAMQDIDGTVLLEMQEEFLPDPGIEGQNQKGYCVEDHTFWHQFNTCWLAFGQRILDFHCNLNSPPDRLIQLVESAGRCLIAIGDDLEEQGLVDYEMGIWEEEILDILGRCLKALQKANRVEVCPGNLGNGLEVGSQYRQSNSDFFDSCSARMLGFVADGSAYLVRDKNTGETLFVQHF